MLPEDVDIWFKVNNIIPEKMDLYYDFSFSLYYLILDTYLGDEKNNETKITLSDEDKKTIIDAAYKFEYTGSEPASFVSEWEKIKKLKNKANPIITAISSATCTIMAIAKKVLGVLQMTKDTMDQIGADTTQLNLGIAYLKKAIELYNNRIDLIAAFCEK